MRRAVEVLPASTWPTSARVDTVTLDHDARHRRRIRMTGATGFEFLLDLAEAAHLRHGDGLALDGGGIVEVLAAPEPLMEVTATSPAALLCLAWHIGNRHLPAAIDGNRILLRQDHVIEDMLIGLGAKVRHLDAPFDPEGGAYDKRGHDHGHHRRHHRRGHGSDHEH
jgi:urease accessory protein